MPQITEIKIHIGADAFQRRLTATRYVGSNAKSMWKLEAEPSCQRDDGERMFSLTDDNLRDLVKALELVK